MSWGAEDLSAALGASSKYDASGELSFTYRLARSLCLAGAVAAGVQPVDGVFADFRTTTACSAEAEAARARRLHRQARHPSRAGRDHQRRFHAVRRGRARTPRKSSPRSRHSPTRACFRSAAKWSIGRIWSRRGAYWNDHDRRLRWPRPQTRRPRTQKPATSRRRQRLGHRRARPAAAADGLRTPRASARRCRDQDHLRRHLPQRPPHLPQRLGRNPLSGDSRPRDRRHRHRDRRRGHPPPRRRHVAVGCMVDSCMECDQCLAGWEVFCRKGCVQTYNSADYHDGTISQGRLHRPYRRPRPFLPESARRHGRQPRRAVAVRRHHHLLAAAPI